MPPLSDDDVIDYMVREAVALRVVNEKNAKAQEVRRGDWRKDHKQWAKEMGLV